MPISDEAYLFNDIPSSREAKRRNVAFVSIHFVEMLRPSILRSHHRLASRLQCSAPPMSRHGVAVRRLACSNSSPSTPSNKTSCGSTKAPSPSMTDLSFWKAKDVWGRAAINTTRCLIGCTAGDFSTMWYLQSQFPDLSMAVTMSASSKRQFYSAGILGNILLTQVVAAGISTSMMLETVLLRLGKDQLAWPIAARTAAGMSLISMITMEIAENSVDYSLTGGVVAFDSPMFWAAALTSIVAGFLAPLPYNYARLRKYGKSCH